jgi:hypothetical protein
MLHPLGYFKIHFCHIMLGEGGGGDLNFSSSLFF